jgi:hypothetical protein
VRTEETLETLLVYGEVLEMRAAADDPWGTSPLVLRPAPPSFVVRKDGTAVVLGVAGDDLTPFPPDLNASMASEGVLRILPSNTRPDLRSLLQELGLIELNEQTWLRLPAIELVEAYLAFWRQQLGAASASAAIEGIRILDTKRPTSFYPDRWVDPATMHSGMYIARRPQRYGAGLWCLVDLERGVPRRFIDLVSKGDRVRPCDIAWRIQMAIDAQAGSPQRFRIRTSEAISILDFLSPIPSWAERKLAVGGRRTAPHKSLLSYSLPTSDLEPEARFLQERLWLQPEALRRDRGP